MIETVMDVYRGEQLMVSYANYYTKQGTLLFTKERNYGRGGEAGASAED